MAFFDFGEAMRAKPEKGRPESRQYLLVLIAVVLIAIIVSLVFIYDGGKGNVIDILIGKETPRFPVPDIGEGAPSSADLPAPPSVNQTEQGSGPTSSGAESPPPFPEEQLPQENPEEFSPATAPSAQSSEPPPALPEFL